MTSPVAEQCRWSEADEEGTHVLCSEPATFSVEVSWPTDDGVKTGRVALCVQHALAASREGIAKR